MYQLIIVLIVIAAIILIFFVVIQNSKGGGLAAGFSSSNQVMGVRKTTDFLEKATWSLAGTIVVLSIVASLFIPRKSASGDDSLKNIIPTEQSTVPDFGTPVPANGNESGNGQTAMPPASTPAAPAAKAPAPAPAK